MRDWLQTGFTAEYPLVDRPYQCAVPKSAQSAKIRPERQNQRGVPNSARHSKLACHAKIRAPFQNETMAFPAPTVTHIYHGGHFQDIFFKDCVSFTELGFNLLMKCKYDVK